MSAGEETDNPPYEVILSPTAERALQAIQSKADLKAVDHILQILDTVPGIGRLYDPIYEAAMPAKPIMVVYAGHFGVYFDVNETRKRVEVAYIEDQRHDPRKRFYDDDDS